MTDKIAVAILSVMVELFSCAVRNVRVLKYNLQIADNSADKLPRVSHCSIRLKHFRQSGHASTSAKNRYVIDVGLVVENISTVSSSRGNNDR